MKKYFTGRMAYILAFAVVLVIAIIVCIKICKPAVVRLVVEAHTVPGDDVFRILYDTGNGCNEKNSENVPVRHREGTLQELSFTLPAGKNIRVLRIDTGNKTGITAIKSIRLTAFNYTVQRWDAKKIVGSFIPNDSIRSFREKNGLAYIEAVREHPFIYGDDLKKYNIINFLVKIFISLPFIICLFLIAIRLPKPAFNHLMIVAFMAVTCLPALEMKLNLVPTMNTEKRELAQKPQLDIFHLPTYCRRYEAYLNDNFGFRNIFIKWNSFLRYSILKTSVVPQVIVGKNGWLFYHSEKANDGITINDMRGLARHSEEDLTKIRENLESQNEYLKQRGIPYIILIAPNKETIYPEYNRDFIRENSTTMLDQLLAYMKKNSDLDIIDVRDELREAKKQYPVYQMTDTHWNDFGAFIGYNALLRHISRKFPCAQACDLSDYEIQPVKSEYTGGDLAAMIFLTEKLGDYYVFVRRIGSDNSSHRCKINRVLLFCDSFADRLKKHLENNCNKMTSLHWNNGFNKNLLEKFKPDLVIFEMAERGQCFMGNFR